MDSIPKLGISSCLLGNKVRYDGRHKYDNWLVEALGRHVQYVPVCPETECGLPVPREPMRLVGEVSKPRMVTVSTGIDHTPRMLDWCSLAIARLAEEELCGFVFKSKSPSCGLERVKVFPVGGGTGARKGTGIFAREFTRAFPMLPVEEEGRLEEPLLRENFIGRVFIMQRWLELQRRGLTPEAVMDFHHRHRLLLMSHSPEACGVLDKLLEEAQTHKPQDFAQTYLRLFMQAAARPATPAKHLKVLRHIMGCFKRELTPGEKAELLEQIEAYRLGQQPLSVPLTLLGHYAREYGKEQLNDQYYINPDPRELAMREHV